MMLEELRQLTLTKATDEKIIILNSLLEIFKALNAKVAKEYDTEENRLKKINMISESMCFHELIHLTEKQVKKLKNTPSANLEGYFQKLSDLLIKRRKLQ